MKLEYHPRLLRNTTAAEKTPSKIVQLKVEKNIFFLKVCCADMNTLLCVYGSTTLKKGESCPFSLDAFTDKNTAQLDHFWTSEMDAFSQDWQGSILWVHPPYSMADLVLQKIKETPNFTGCVFLPEWFTEDWFLEFMDCCTTFRSFHHSHAHAS